LRCMDLMGGAAGGAWVARVAHFDFWARKGARTKNTDHTPPFLHTTRRNASRVEGSGWSDACELVELGVSGEALIVR